MTEVCKVFSTKDRSESARPDYTLVRVATLFSQSMSSNFESSAGEELNRYKVSRECTRCPGDGDNRGARTKPLKKRGTTAHTATIILTPGTESRATLRLLDFQYRFRSDIDLLILHRSFLKHAVSCSQMKAISES